MVAKLTGPAAPADLAPLLLTFSARTSAGMVQDIIGACVAVARVGMPLFLAGVIVPCDLAKTE